MAVYGRGQMLGSGINPESFKQDYSGFANAAAIQAQGLSNLGESIGGAIDNYGKMKKQQQEDERSVQKSKSVAKAIGDLIPDLKPTLQNSLLLLDDKEIPLSQRKAEADAISDILTLGIGAISNKQKLDFEKSKLIAENAPDPLSFTSKLLDAGPGKVAVKEGSDGKYYDEDGIYPIRNMQAYIAGEPPEVYSGAGAVPSPAAGINSALKLTGNLKADANAINNATPLPEDYIYTADGSPGSLPPVGTPVAGADTSLLPPVLGNNDPQAEMPPPQAETQAPRKLTSRLILDSKQETFRPATVEESAMYGGMPGQMSSLGKFLPINLPSGFSIEQTPEGGLKVIQGAGVGRKTEGVEKAREDMSDQSFRLNQNNTEEAFTRLDEIGTNSPIFAAGNTLLANALPATDQGELQGFFERVNGENSFIKMSQLRASSPTGGAAGTMTEKEWPRFEGRFSPLRVNAKKDTLAKSLSLNLLNAFEAANGTPDDVVKLLNQKKIDQPTFDNYVQEYLTNRKVARVNDNGIEGASYDWTKINKELLNKSTSNKPAGTGVGLSPEAQDILKELNIK